MGEVLEVSGAGGRRYKVKLSILKWKLGWSQNREGRAWGPTVSSFVGPGDKLVCP